MSSLQYFSWETFQRLDSSSSFPFHVRVVVASSWMSSSGVVDASHSHHQPQRSHQGPILKSGLSFPSKFYPSSLFLDWSNSFDSWLGLVIILADKIWLDIQALKNRANSCVYLLVSLCYNYYWSILSVFSVTSTRVGSWNTHCSYLFYLVSLVQMWKLWWQISMKVFFSHKDDIP